MFRQIFATALVAGIVAGLGMSVLQEFTTTPIILHAEQFENSSGGAHGHGMLQGPERLFLAHGPAAETAEPEAWAPEDGIERTLFTSLANILAGVGFALLLAAAFALAGKPIDGRKGVVWGLAGFAVFTLGPALGLPPEVPGSMAAELGGRQAWWLGCAAATAAGLWMMVFRQGIAWAALGIVLIAAPHIVGAPQPERIGGAVPPELAGHFAAASIVTTAVFWCALGWLSGTVWQRLERAA
jgi:cobalt transporter subunit CbtA